MPGVGGDERRILDDPLLDREPLYFELPLKFLPDHRVLTHLGQTFTKQPDRWPIRDGRWIAQEMAERDPIRCLAFQFRIGQPIPLLEHPQAEYEDSVTVRAAAFIGIVRIQARQKRAESIPLDQIPDLA